MVEQMRPQLPKLRALVDFLSERVFPDNPQPARQ